MLSAIQQQIENIQDGSKPLFKSVETALDLSAVKNDKLIKAPAAYVIPIHERPSKNLRQSNSQLQRVTVVIGIAIALKKFNDKSGSNGNAVLQQCRTAVKNALYGWSPTAGYDPIERGNSDLLKMSTSTVWWLDQFITSYFEKATQ